MKSMQFVLCPSLLLRYKLVYHADFFNIDFSCSRLHLIGPTAVADSLCFPCIIEESVHNNRHSELLTHKHSYTFDVKGYWVHTHTNKMSVVWMSTWGCRAHQLLQTHPHPSRLVTLASVLPVLHKSSSNLSPSQAARGKTLPTTSSSASQCIATNFPQEKKKFVTSFEKAEIPPFPAIWRFYLHETISNFYFLWTATSTSHERRLQGDDLKK